LKSWPTTLIQCKAKIFLAHNDDIGLNQLELVWKEIACPLDVFGPEACITISYRYDGTTASRCNQNRKTLRTP
jgi:hypothetical protein